MVAVYKGLKVAVYTVEKPEVNLTRQHLIEHVNVRSILLHYCVRYFSITGYFACT